MHPMIVRVFIALIGAAIVTTGLLLGMDYLTSLFRERTGERVFRITDVLPRAEPGRPERPPPRELEPDVPTSPTELPSADIAPEPPRAPASPPSTTIPAPAIEPPQPPGSGN